MEVDPLFDPAIRKWTAEITIHDHGTLHIKEIVVRRDGKTVCLQFDEPAPMRELGALIQDACEVNY